jgi:hypothetical protein
MIQANVDRAGELEIVCQDPLDGVTIAAREGSEEVSRALG